MNFDIIKVLALFNCCNFCTEALRQWSKDLPHYLWVLRFLTLVELANNHLIQLAIEWVKWLILTHFQLSGQHLQLSVYHFLCSFICGLQYLPRLLGNSDVRYPVELIWRNTIKNCIQNFTISVSCRKNCLISSRFSSLQSSPSNIHHILNGFINRTQKCPHPDFPKGIVATIKIWWTI